MDGLYGMNLGVGPQGGTNTGGVNVSVNVNTTQNVSQVNGLPQESKLATYMNLSSSGQQQQTSTAEQQITKSVSALSLDAVQSRKVTVESPSRSRISPPGLGGGGGGGGGGDDGGVGSNLSTYHENVGGTTYFFTAQDPPTFGSGPGGATASPAPFSAPPPTLVFPPCHVLPPVPAHIHHLRLPANNPHFFMGDELRRDILERHALSLSRVDPEQYPDLPSEVDMYHELVPLEAHHNLNKSSIFGYATSVYKATNIKTGLHYCLYRINGYRLSNVKVTQLLDLWKKLQHSSVIQLRELFTTKAFNDNSIVFVYDYHAGSETLASRHFNTGTPAITNTNGWQTLGGSGGASGANSGATDGTRVHKSHRHNSGTTDPIQGGSGGMQSESVMWNYIIQLTGALRTIHTQGLACRVLQPSKILLTDNKSRIRINCCGIIDVLNFDPNAQNPLANIPQYQQEDLVSLGRLMIALACNSMLALNHDNIQCAIECINTTYSRDLAMLLVCLLTSQRIKTVNDVMPMIGARFYTALESSTQRADVVESELWKEIHNARLFRILTKLSTIVDRPQLHMDTTWCETGDRYLLKLFRDYLLHQETDDGRPWLDFAHVVSVLNKLDAGTHDKICLMSHDGQNILVTSYAELKNCFERSFNELLQAAHTITHSHNTQLNKLS